MRRGDIHEHFGNRIDQTRGGHDAGVERVLKNNARNSLDTFDQIGDIGGRCAEQQDAQEQDNEVDQIEIQRAAIDKVINDIGDTEQADQLAQDAAVVQTRGDGVFGDQIIIELACAGRILIDGGIDFHHAIAGLGVGCSQALSKGRVIMIARLVSSIGIKKIVSLKGIVPICAEVGCPGVATSTGILADRPRPYMVKPLYAAAVISG